MLPARVEDSLLPELPRELQAQVTRLRELVHDVARLRVVFDPLGDLSIDGLAPHHLQAVWWLRRDGLLSVNSLARRLGITVPKCTRILDRLEERELAFRGRSEQDRRVARIRLSDPGRALAEHLDRTANERLARLLLGLEPEDRGAFLRIVERLRMAAVR